MVEKDETRETIIGQVTSSIPNSDGWYDISGASKSPTLVTRYKTFFVANHFVSFQSPGLSNLHAVVKSQDRTFLVVKDADESKDIVIDDVEVCCSLCFSKST